MSDEVTSSKYFCSCGKTTLLDGSQSCLCNEIERLRAYKDSYPPDFIEKLQHDLDVAGIRIKELERELFAILGRQ